MKDTNKKTQNIIDIFNIILYKTECHNLQFNCAISSEC